MTFSPTSVAVIGASASEHKVGHMVLKNLVEQGFEGDIYPINPKGGEILGKTVYTSLTEIEGDVNMAIVITPAPTVTAVAKECGEKGVQWLVVITAGFSEVHTDEGKQMEDELVKVCNEYEMNLIGPNCLGVLRMSSKMNGSFAKELPPTGNIALVSQSGAMAVALMDAAPAENLGFSLVLSIGNKAQMDECDYLELCLEDEETKVIGMYLESIKNGRRFLEVASRVTKQKPVVILKSGVSEHGGEAAASHTGALAGSDAAIEAACVQTGIHRANTAQELLGLLKALSAQPPLLSPRIAIITNAGGPGILATDAAEALGLQMPAMSDSTMERLKEALPASAGLVNPIDVIGDATTDRYKAAIEACGDDPQIDGIAVLLTPQVMTPCSEIAKVVVEESKTNRLLPIVTSFMGGESVAEAETILAEGGVPNFPTPERVMKALAALRADGSGFGLGSGSLSRPGPGPDSTKILGGQSGLLSEEKTSQLLKLYNLPIPNQDVAKTPEEAITIAKEIGFPVIAKISSPQIIHKTDVGGIIGNLQSEEDVANAFEEIMRNVACHFDIGDNSNVQRATCERATVNGILIQKFLPVGSEFIVGGLRDPSFGPMVMVGLGGIYTELFKDTSFRIAPISEEEGYRMLQELTAWKLLLGMRGAAQSDIDGLVQIVVAVSNLMHECPQVKEMDFNPVLVGEEGVIVADAKIVVS